MTTEVALADTIQAVLNEFEASPTVSANDLSFDVPATYWLQACAALRDHKACRFEQLIELFAVDYLGFGQAEWQTQGATSSGFSRAVDRDQTWQVPAGQKRFAVIVHLLSVTLNQRVTLRVFCEDDSLPRLPSLMSVWRSADWYEREAFDLFGVLFDGHPDLRRLLTDYGFIGHPFRKDFPLIGEVEVRYDPEAQRVKYQPVSIEPRTLVPKVIREDARYSPWLSAGIPEDAIKSQAEPTAQASEADDA